MRDGTAKRLSTIHRWIFRASGGRVGKRLVDNDMLLLTTTGAVSGSSHTVPLLYLKDGERLIVIASWGGRPDHPHWYVNLVADPEVTVELPGRKFAAVARTADPAEHTEWWPKVMAAYDGYREYQSRTDRVIPIVFLEPT